MPWPNGVIPYNIRRIEFVSRTNGHVRADGQAWVDENGYVQGDTESANRWLDEQICPNVKTRRHASREDGSLMLYGYCLEAIYATYWSVRILELDPPHSA